MKVLAIRSVSLSQEVYDSYKSAGIDFIERDATGVDMDDYLVTQYDTVLSLGSRKFKPRDSVPWFNKSQTILAVSNTAELRKTLDGKGMPQSRRDVPHWHKFPGFGGKGARFCEHIDFCDTVDVTEHEIQEHILGDEYRVVTVGNLVVQAAKKVNCEWVSGRHYFDYEWCGVAGVNGNGIIPLLKTAIEAIPGGECSVLGWDVMVSDRPYIIECNTSPGVNEATAQRIVKGMEMVL